MSEDSNSVSRRNVLRGGAAVGGLVWTVPLVQAVSMTPAHAATSSAPASVQGIKAGSTTVAGSSSVSSVSGSALPRTGADLGPVVAVGAGALAAGAAAVVAARKLSTPGAETPRQD